MTAIENDVDVDVNPTEADGNGTTEAAAEAPAVRYPTYRELAFATWKLAYQLAYVEDQFCSDGANEYLAHFGLPALTRVDGNEELKNSYLTAWYNFKHWAPTGELTEVDDANSRTRLARAIRRQLESREPKSRATMNGWLTELGLELFQEPNHIGRYNVEHRASATVNSEMITRALNAMFPEVNARVSYDRRVQ